MKQILLVLISCLSLSSLIAQSSQQWTIDFETDKSKLTEIHQSTLQSIITFCEAYDVEAILIEGHTDNVGSKSYNQTLSRKRAESVQNYLIANGMRSQLIQIQVLDYSKPVATNDDEQGRSQNRRTDITILFHPEEVFSNVSTPDEINEFVSLEVDTTQLVQIIDSIVAAPDTQIVELKKQTCKCDERSSGWLIFDSKKSYNVIAPSGNKLFFNGTDIKNFTEFDGDRFVIEFEEYTSMTTILCSGASTRSGNGMLKSAGMLSLKIKTESGRRMYGCVTFEMPSKKIEGMGAYVDLGRRSIQNANWRQSSKAKIKYDETKQAYIFSFCGNLSSSMRINLDIDVPFTTVPMRGTKDYNIYVEHPDGMLSKVIPLKVYNKEHKRLMKFPRVENGTIKVNPKNNKEKRKVYEKEISMNLEDFEFERRNGLIWKYKTKNGNRNVRRKIIKGRDVNIFKRPKIKLRQILKTESS